MSRSTDWREYLPEDLPKVLDAALQEFAENGYHGTSIRDIAARAKLSVPGLYHYHASKQDILVALVSTVMNDLITRCESALATASSPEERFDRLVECLVRFHMFRREAAFVAASEARSLDPEQRREYVASRNRVQALIDEVIADGHRSGVFATPYAKDAGRAITTMAIGVASWYRADGALSADEVVRRQVEFARGVVGRR